MNVNVHMEDRHLALVKQILSKYPYTFYAYGSRVTGKNKKWSDLDICCMGTPIEKELDQLDEDFGESDIPFIVQVFVWDRLDHAFRESIKKDFVPLQEKLKKNISY